MFLVKGVTFSAAVASQVSFTIFLKLIYAVLYKDGPQASEGGRGKRTRFEYIWHIPGKLLVLFHFASIKYLFLLFPYVRAMV